MWTPSYTDELHGHHERPLPGLHLLPARQAAGQEPRPAEPDQARALHRGRAARRRHRRRRAAPAGWPSRCRAFSTSSASPSTAQFADGPRRTRGWSSTPPASRTRPSCSALRDFFSPLLRSLASCPRVVVLGTPPEQVKGGERVAQRALEGFTRSLGKEIGTGRHRPARLRRRGRRGRGRLDPGLPALAQVGLRLRPGGPHRRARRQDGRPRSPTGRRPLAGKVALVTGASRGIGEQIARVLHRDGATVVGVDVPQARRASCRP